MLLIQGKRLRFCLNNITIAQQKLLLLLALHNILVTHYTDRSRPRYLGVSEMYNILISLAFFDTACTNY